MTWLPLMESHFGNLRSAIVDRKLPMWPSVVDVRTRRFPDGEHVPRRVYRLIGAPRGSTLYWDQPLLVAAYALAELTGSPRHAESADANVRAFLDHCIAPNGMFQWGNHAYFDLFERRIVEFHKGYHELRPITPAWNILWRHAPDRTAAYIRTMARRHVYDPATGGFNRHDTGTKGHAFLEAGGILVESLAWLHARTADKDLLDQALRIARYSYRHRGAATGLVRNEPDMGRWDAKVSTSEVGLWAQCLLRANAYTSNDEFVDMARSAVRAYLKYAYEESSGCYYGQVDVETGAPVIAEAPGYWPRRYADPWTTDQWPTHDYPVALAEACLTLHEQTGDVVYRDAVHRLARVAMNGRPSRTGRWAYAESYGRCIHFLARAGLELGDEQLITAATSLADEALDRLCENGMFQGYSGGHVYESVDGVGYLFLALISLEMRREPEMYGFRF